jgi:hypothetical protein
MEGSFFYKNFSAYPFGCWLMTGAGLFWEKSTDNWFILREKYNWLVIDKSNEQDVC